MTGQNRYGQIAQGSNQIGKTSLSLSGVVWGLKNDSITKLPSAHNCPFQSLHGISCSWQISLPFSSHQLVDSRWVYFTAIPLDQGWGTFFQSRTIWIFIT